MTRRLPKRIQKLVDDARAEAYQTGHQVGRDQGRKEGMQHVEDKKAKQKADTQALEAVARLASTFSQSIEAICRAMYDGRGM